MGDEDDRREFIDSNLLVLTKSTHIGFELVIGLYSRKLITEEEKDLLNDDRTPNIRRAGMLYTTIANKWSQRQFEDFKAVLEDTGNHLALQVFTNAGADIFLTNDQVQLLREQRHKSVDGCYEGLSHEDEVKANKVVQMVRGDNSGMFREDNNGKLKFVLSGELNRKELVPLVKTFEEALKNKTIWWNPRKPQLPKNYVERRFAKFTYFRYDGTLPSPVRPRTLTEELKSDKLVLLVDPPGMGKSSEMTHLEQKLRVGVTSNRIILRVNLNEVQTTLKNLSSEESVSSVLLKLAHPFLPPASLEIPNLSLFILLDGLDEVCPTHKTKMISLLKILSSTEEGTQTRDIRVVLTTRPHLREAVEREFNLKSVSLLPLTEEEQDEYAKEVLGVSSEQLSGIRGKLTDSVKGLLSNPLMLNMFVDVIKSGGTFTNEGGGGGGVVNIFDLYTRFVDSKHKLHLVEKEKMGAEDNFTEMRLGGMLQRNLPQYYRMAVNLLIRNYSREKVLQECGGSVVAQEDEPSGVTRDELLSVGLLVEDGDNRLVFKHRSFGEFFYARLFTQEESAPQNYRDALFGNIINNVLGNVEAFIVGALPAATALASSASVTNRPKLTSCGACDSTAVAAAVAQFPSPLLFTLSPKWILMERDVDRRCSILHNLVNRSKLFPLLGREVLLSFLNGDSTDDLWEVQNLLLDRRCKSAFTAFIRWMRENGEWTKGELLNCGERKSTALLFALTLQEEEELLTEDEVGVALNSLNNKLIYFVTSFMTQRGSKWEWVERHLPGGRSQLRNLFIQMDNEDLFVVIEDVETSWKLVQILTREEIGARVTNEETRVSDVIGENPVGVVVALGGEFLPPPKQLAEFRRKFCEEKEYKGTTVFEMGGCDFALEYLWGELVGEAERGDRSGPVGVALREALGRMRGWESCYLLRKLEWEEVHRRRRSQGGSEEHLSERSGAEEAEEVAMATEVLDWVGGGRLRWRDYRDTIFFLEYLPFLLRYYGNVTPSKLTKILQEKKGRLKESSDVMGILRSLVILSSSPSSSFDSSPSFSFLFSFLTSFLRENINEVPKDGRSLVDLFLGATREEIQAATAASSSSLSLVREVCVGGVALRLLATTKQPTHIVDKTSWEVLLGDVIQTARSCDLRVLLPQLRQQMEEQQTQMGNNHLETRLKELLTSKQVISQWKERFGAWNRRQGEECDWCGLRHFLTFYFSVFGADNLEWMKEHKWILVREIPVEIATVLQGEEMKENYGDNNKLAEKFAELVRECLGIKDVTFLNEIGLSFCYKNEWEWEALINLLGGKEALLEDGTFPSGRHFYPFIAAPLIRVFIRMFGVEWTSTYLRTHQLWEKIPSTRKYRENTVESLGSLLHSAIELGEWEEVKKRAFPGLVLSWRNGKGKTALEVAKETTTKDVKDRQGILVHLEDLVSSVKT